MDGFSFIKEKYNKAEDFITTRCRCCLNENELSGLWTESATNGKEVIYGELIEECFGFSWDNYHLDEQICAQCIQQLCLTREFRATILKTNEILKNVKVSKQGIKSEDVIDDNTENIEVLDESIFEIEIKPEGDIKKTENDSDDDNELQFEESAEYLEFEQLDDDDDDDDGDEDDLNDPKTEDGDNESPSKDDKKQKKKSKQKKLEKTDKPPHFDKNNEAFAKEVQLILTYTNATPFKSKYARFYCAYCKGKRSIDTAEALRVHTRTEHATDRINKVADMLTPTVMNEILKLEIKDLMCVVCFKTIEDWNQMFQHLQEKHDVELDKAYAKVVPYKLDLPMHCALCADQFYHFHALNSHMNAHYNNYVCADCGESFLSNVRMQKHTVIHTRGKFSCSFCDKVFNLDKYRRKHEKIVHHPLYFACQKCSERFPSQYNRHKHCVSVHGDPAAVFACEFCPKTFEWRPYYLKHVRITHGGSDKKLQCRFCDKKFNMKHELANHMDWHNNAESNVCPICDKKFMTKNYLKKHISLHNK